MRISHIDELVDFNYRVKTLVTGDQGILALLGDDPDIGPDSSEAEILEAQVKDHDYVDETSLRANAYIIIDTEVVSRDTATMKSLYLYVQVICEKSYMALDPKKFGGLKGNRRDNLCRRIDNLLNGNGDFGIGELQLKSATIPSLPTGYTGRTLTYMVPNFA